MSAQTPATETESGELFIPDLCRMRAVLTMIIATELMVLLFALVQATDQWLAWDYLGLASLLAQWIVLTSAALICALRQILARLTAPLATTAVLALVLADITLFTLVAQWLIAGASPIFLPDWQELGRNLLIGGVITLGLLRNFYIQHQWQLQKQAELRARVAALQARIQPHFLFNSMNTIASLIATDPQKAEDVVLDLSELFRASLRSADDHLIPLKREIELCHQYLRIESLRLGNRLQVQWDLDPDAEQQPLPPLTLQPLLENAIYHGIQPLKGGGTLSIRTETTRDWVYVLIHNPLPAADSTRHQGHRIALENIRARLATVYAEPAILKTSQQGTQFTVTLRLPRELEENPTP